MKKYCLLIFTLLILFANTQPSLAAGSGACSSHGGVNCSKVDLYDGSVICNDEWEDSTVLYKDVSVCADWEPKGLFTEPFHSTTFEQYLEFKQRISNLVDHQQLNSKIYINLTSDNIRKITQDAQRECSEKTSPSYDLCKMLGSQSVYKRSFGLLATLDIFEKKAVTHLIDLGSLFYYDAQMQKTYEGLTLDQFNKARRDYSVNLNNLKLSHLNEVDKAIEAIKTIQPKILPKNIDMQAFCASSLGQDSTFSSVTGNCQCRSGFEKRDDICKPTIPALSGAPKTKSDLLRCLFVGNKTNKFYYAKGHKTVAKMTLTGKTCFTKEADAQKAGYKKTK